MTRLSEINNYAETTTAQLIAVGASKAEIDMHFKLMVQRVEHVLHQYDIATKLEFLQNLDLLPPNALQVVHEAVDAILKHSPDLLSDINFINDSGIHAIIDINHLNLVLSTIFARADLLHRGSAIKVWFGSMFRKQGYYTTKYNKALFVEEPTLVTTDGQTA